MRVPQFLPNICLIDVVPGPRRRFRMRLVGGALVEAGFAGRPGDFMDAPHIAPDPTKVVGALDDVAETGRPDWRRGPAVVDHTKFVDSLERVLLPLARDGTHVDMIMSYTIFHWHDGRTT
ncbi:MAG: hypothetical protein JNL66_06075 [Alphaproteobacteria bacterium]|nr:hypothetical protein [Alphaproteobacteria bacterium]